MSEGGGLHIAYQENSFFFYSRICFFVRFTIKHTKLGFILNNYTHNILYIFIILLCLCILAKHLPSAGFPSPSGEAVPAAPPLDCLRRSFGKLPPSAAAKEIKNIGAPGANRSGRQLTPPSAANKKKIWGAFGTQNFGRLRCPIQAAPAAPQMILKT